MSDPAHTPALPDTTDLPNEVTQVAGLVRADRRNVPAHEHRVALAALQLLGAIEGTANVDERLAAIVRRNLADPAALLACEVRAAGWSWPASAGGRQ